MNFPIRCPACVQEFGIWIWTSGMSDIAHFYCEKCPNTLAIHLYSTYANDRVYRGLTCECGGSFSKVSYTHCPHCLILLDRDEIKRQIHWWGPLDGGPGGVVVVGSKCFKGNGEIYDDPGIEKRFGSWIG